MQDVVVDLDNPQSPQPAEFHASWMSARGWSVVFLGVVLVCFAIAAIAMEGAGRWVFAACAALMAAFAWAIGRVLWEKLPVVRVGPEGISGRGLRETIAWDTISDLSLQAAGGGMALVVVHRITAPGAKARQDNIPLGALHAKLHAVILQTAYQFFVSRASEQARQAITAHEQELAVHNEFDAKLVALTPRVWAMPTVMGICAAVWVANVISGMSPMQPHADELYRWGANSASAVQAGQWWRLVTAMFLHGGIIHLALNMYALWEAGLMVTRLFGNRGFLVVYFGAGLVGSALSLHFSGQTGVSVGASGAVFGVAGALLAAVIQHRGKFPMGRSKQLLTSLGVFILYSLAYGFSKQGIDNAAHIGGLLSGFAAGWLLVEKLDDTATPARRPAAMAGAVAVCIAATVALVMFAAPARRNMETYFSDIKRWNSLQTELSKTMQALRDDSLQNKAGKLDEGAMLRRLETVHAPALHRLESKFAKLHLPPDEMVGRFAAAQQRFAGAMAALMDTEAQRQKAPTPELAEKTQRLSAEVKQAREAIDALNAETSPKK